MTYLIAGLIIGWLVAVYALAKSAGTADDAQIATLQHERAIERLPEQQRAQARQHAADAFGGEVEA